MSSRPVRHLHPHSSPQPKKRALIDRAYECEYCATKFANLSSVGRHQRRSCKKLMKKKEESNDFQCATCNRTFSKKVNMERHMKIHTRDQDFLCEICNKRYTDQSSLVRHQQIHRRTNESRTTNVTCVTNSLRLVYT